MANTVSISSPPPNPIPGKVRNDIYSSLISSGGIRNIEAKLTHTLQSTGFLDDLKAYITYLYRSGECTTHNEVMAKVRERMLESNIGSPKSGREAEGRNGVTNGVNGHSNGNGAMNGSKDNEYRDPSDFTLRIDERVTKEGANAVLIELRNVCELQPVGDE